MNIRKTLTGVGLAAVLGLTSFSGVMAQQETKVGLEDDPANGCSVSVTAGNVDFGTAVWDGTEYTFTGIATDQKLSFSVADNRAPGENGICKLNITGADLLLDGTGTGPTETIGVANVVLDNVSGTGVPLSTSAQDYGNVSVLTSPTAVNLDITLLTTGITNQVAGTYTAEITVQVADVAQP